MCYNFCVVFAHEQVIHKDSDNTEQHPLIFILLTEISVDSCSIHVY